MQHAIGLANLIDSRTDYNAEMASGQYESVFDLSQDLTDIYGYLESNRSVMYPVFIPHPIDPVRSAKHSNQSENRPARAVAATL